MISILKNLFKKDDSIYKRVSLNGRTLNWEDFLYIQNELNKRIREDWMEVRTLSEISVAIFSELSELLDCYNWKWWKAGEIDKWNAAIETIDIFHFVLSYMLMMIPREEDISNFPAEFDLDDVFAWSPLEDEFEFNHQSFFNTVNNLIDRPYNKNYMYELFKAVGFQHKEEVAALYVAKSTLNVIREEGGYKTGKYIKNKDGVEDNQRLEHVVSHFLKYKNLKLRDVKNLTEKEFCDV